jgi:NAD(P)-dependent dehydrogenase (short-subunit alcohol dehydrogenase family)
MKSDLEGKVVLVTGASGGIGSAVARRFGEEDARVVLHYHQNRAGAEALRAEMNSAQALVVRADLTKEAAVVRMFAQAAKKFGRVDTLIANAGATAEPKGVVICGVLMFTPSKKGNHS